MSGQHHAPAAPPGKELGTHGIGGWVSLRAGLEQRLDGSFFPQPWIEPRSVCSQILLVHSEHISQARFSLPVPWAGNG
jgi:hypothetical protein